MTPLTPEEELHLGDDEAPVEVPTWMYWLLVTYEAVPFDPKSMKNISIDFGEVAAGRADRGAKLPPAVVPQWVRGLFPFATKAEAEAVLTTEEWTAFFAVCHAEHLYRGAVATVYALKDAKAAARP